MNEQKEGGGLFVRLKPRAGKVLRFVLDGRVVEAADGDTVLTAILLNAARLREFEFGGGSRAGYCLMGACQDCWVRLSDGRSVAACSTLLTEGMVVTTREEKV